MRDGLYLKLPIEADYRTDVFPKERVRLRLYILNKLLARS